MTDTVATSPSSLRHLPWAVLVMAGVGAALYLRYGLIQSTPIGLSCLDEGAAPWYCAPREALVRFNMMAGWSFVALIGGGLALATRWRVAIGLGLLAGSMGLVLYNAGPAGAGLILSLAALLRAATHRRD